MNFRRRKLFFFLFFVAVETNKHKNFETNEKTKMIINQIETILITRLIIIKRGKTARKSKINIKYKRSSSDKIFLRFGLVHSE